jgi:hypothetical protein
MFKALKATVLKIDDVKPSAVFNAYAEGTGFFSGEGKKDQFPDAFIFERLKAEASKSTPVMIVSDDGDFDAPAKAEEHIMLVKSIPDLFKKLGLQVDAPEVDQFLEDSQTDLVALVDKELDDWGLIGDVEDSDIEETKVKSVEIVTSTSFGSIEEGEPIIVIARLAVKADASYTHPNWDEAAYDSEDKVLIPFDNVSGTSEVSFDVDVLISILVDDEGQPSQIEELQFRNSDFQYVELHPYDPYEYM